MFGLFVRYTLVKKPYNVQVDYLTSFEYSDSKPNLVQYRHQAIEVFTDLIIRYSWSPRIKLLYIGLNQASAWNSNRK